MHKSAQIIYNYLGVLRLRELQLRELQRRCIPAFSIASSRSNSSCNRFRNIITKLLVGILVSTSAEISANSDDDLFNVPLEDLLKVEVVTSAKLPRSIKNSPGTITVFTAKEIKLFGARDLTDVLAKIPGVLPCNDATTNKYRFSIRGDQTKINSNHVLVLLNGIPFNRESFGGNWTTRDIVSMPLSAIKQIEVVRGPGSVLYGINAYSCVINIVTKDADEMDDAITLGGGDHTTSSADLSYGSKNGDLQITSALRFYETAGAAMSSNVQGDSAFHSEPGESTPSVLLGLKYRDFHTMLHAARANLETIRGLPTQLADGEIATDKIYFNLGYAHALSEDWSAQVDVSHVRRRTIARDIFVAPIDPFQLKWMTHA